MSKIIDIREEEEVVTQIIFGEEDVDGEYPDSIISVDDAIKIYCSNGGKSIEIVQQDVDNLIKALQKTKELGWY